MKVGIFGGTFNPIHNSHVYLGEEFLKALSLDKLIIMPTYQPPHKTATDLASTKDRLAMCRLATENLKGFSVCDYETRQPDKSYTYKTLTWLKEKEPNATLYFIMGSDMFFTVDDWKEPQEIYKRAVLCVAAREDHELEKLKQQQDYLKTKGAESIVLNIAPKPMSSTKIRESIAKGEDLSDFLNPKVISYIKEHNLYAGAPSEK